MANLEADPASVIPPTTTTSSTTTTSTTTTTTATTADHARRRHALPPDMGRWRRNTELGLVLFAALITVAAYVLASFGRTADLPPNIIPFLVVVVGLLLVAHVATRFLASGADEVLLPVALLLNGARLRVHRPHPREPGRQPGHVDADRHRRLRRHARRRAAGRATWPATSGRSRSSASCC